MTMVFTSYLKSTVYRCYQELCRCPVAEGQKFAFAQAKLIFWLIFWGKIFWGTTWWR